MTTFTQRPTPPETQLRHDLDFSLEMLAPGDIIATNNNAKSSGTIRWATNGKFSHAILALGNGRGVEANPGSGVQVTRLSRTLANANTAAVFRHRTASTEKLQRVANWAAAEAKIMAPGYDYTGAARSAFQPGSNLHNKAWGLRLFTIAIDEATAFASPNGHNESFYCSELIFRAFHTFGIPLLEKSPRLLGPNQLLKTQDLVLMGYLRGSK